MKVAMYYNNNDIRILEIPIPEINDDEILMEVAACGICGSDVMEWYRVKKAPLVLGHEAVGKIKSKGKNVNHLKIGQRIFASHHVPCEVCYFCNKGFFTSCETLHKTNFFPGGFSQYIKIPKINVEKGILQLPQNMTYEQGVFIEPLATVLRAQNLSKIQENDTILIIGCGMSGLLHVKLAKHKKAKIFATDINDFRLNAAKKFGADFIINANTNIEEKIKESNDGRLADKVIVCTGSLNGAMQSLKSVAKGGTLLFFAVPKPEDKLYIPINDFWRNEIKIMTSYGASPQDLKNSLELIKKKKIIVEDMITHKYSLKDSGKAFKIVADALESIKVIIYPNN